MQRRSLCLCGFDNRYGIEIEGIFLDNKFNLELWYKLWSFLSENKVVDGRSKNDGKSTYHTYYSSSANGPFGS